MGSLGGHLVPGSFFIIFAIWWSIVTALRFHQSRTRSTYRKKSTTTGYRSTVTMPCICLSTNRLRRAPVESYVKFAFGIIGCIIETISGFDFNKLVPAHPMNSMNSTHSHDHSHHEHQHKRAIENSTDMTMIKTWSFAKGNLQHITMYFSFALGGLVEIALHHGASLPYKLDFVCGFMAFSIEAFLFAFHLHGKEAIEVYVHVLLVYAIVGCAVFTALEMSYPKQILLTYGRIMFTMLQGTWFWHVGFLLYPPTDSPAWHWDLSDHTQIMTITVSYCWHVILIFMFLVIEIGVTKCVCINSEKYRLQLEELMSIDNMRRENSRGNNTPINNSNVRFMPLNSEESEDEDVIYNNSLKTNSKFSTA